MAPALVAEGVPIRRGIAVGGGRTLAEMSFAGVSDRFPFVLSLPQARTEAILEQRVRQLDPDAVHRGVRVTRLHDDGGQVTAEATAGGPAVRYTAALAIAADGVRSTVRPLLGTPVRAKDYPDSYLMGDFADTTGFGPDAALFLESAGIVESFPLPGGLRRWVVRLADRRRGTPGRHGRPLARSDDQGTHRDRRRSREQQHAEPLRRPHPAGHAGW